MSGRGGVAEDRQVHPVIVDHPPHRLEAGEPRAEQQPTRAGLAREPCPRKDLISRSGHVGDIQARQPGLPVGARHRLGAQRNPFLEAAERLVGDAVVILNEVHAPEGARIGHVGQVLRRQS